MGRCKEGGARGGWWGRERRAKVEGGTVRGWTGGGSGSVVAGGRAGVELVDEFREGGKVEGRIR